jgi:hypothetical protein
VSRDELLGRARRAVSAVAGTAGSLGGRVRRERDDEPALPQRDRSRPRPAPTPGLPPRIEREPTPGLPPRIERDAPTPAGPPRIEREPEPGLPPRIDREPTPGLPPRIEREPEVSGTQPDTAYTPRHARTESGAAPPPPPPPVVPEPQPESDPEPGPVDEIEPADELDFEDEDELLDDERFAPAAAPVAAGGAAAPRPAPAAAWQPPSKSSTVRNAMRPHVRFLSVIMVVLVVLGVGYFALRIHQRISRSSLESQIHTRDHAQAVRCSALQSNGSAWACAVIFRAESECLIARVNVLGSWSTVVRARRCARIEELVALLPQKVTPAGVAADVGQQLGIAGLTCRKVPQHEVRWACGRPPAPGGQCLVVREINWQTWPTQAGGRLCDHFPALETAIRASQGEA